MANEPIRNPATNPAKPIGDIGTEGITPNEPTESPSGTPTKTFQMPEKEIQGQAAGQISPMDLSHAQSQHLTPQAMSERIQYMNAQLGKTQALLQENGKLLQNYPDLKLNQAQAAELQTTMGGLHEDLRNMGSLTQSPYKPPQDSGSLLKFVTDFVSGGQNQFEKALQYLGSVKNPNPAEMLKLSYTVQRASQKTELFASIIGSAVGGIKALFGTQLG